MTKSALRRTTLLALTSLIVILSACSRDPNARKQKYFESGQAYFAKAQFQEAAVEFLNAVQVDPNFADAHYKLAQSFVKTMQFGRAVQELQRTIEIQPANYPAHIDLANLLIAGGNLAQAQQQADLLLAQQPNGQQVHVVLSSLKAARGDTPGAVDEMEKAVALGANGWESYDNLALLEARNNQPDAAEATFKRALEVDPKVLDTLMLLGAFYQAQGRPTDAEQQFRNAMTVAPKDPSPRVSLARLLWLQGKKQEAEDFLREAKRDFPDTPAGYRLLGDFYSSTGDLTKATAEFAVLHQEHPADIPTEQRYIELLIGQNRLDEARTLNEEILHNHAQDSDALIARGQIQIREGRPGDAATTLQTLAKNDPDNGLAHYHLGVALEKQGNLPSAESEWREAARLRPDLVEAQRALAGAAMRKNDMSALEQTATQIIRLLPSSPDGYAMRAISYINRRLYSQAEADTQRAMQVAPGSPIAYIQLGNLRFVEKRLPEAERAYRDALDRNPDFTDALRGLLNTYLAQGQIDRAVAAANQQIAKSPNNGDFYDLLGTVLFHNKADLNAAEIALKKSAALNPGNGDALLKLAQVQAARGDNGQAIATLEQSIKDHPQDASLCILLGELYASRQDWTRAEDNYQKALTIKAEHPIASGDLAYAMLRSGQNLDVALALAQTARRGMPQSPIIADILGQIYFEKGAYQSAIGLFRDALQLNQQVKSSADARIHYHLGLTYAKTGQPALARQQLEQALKINPDAEEAADARKQLAGLRS